MRALPQSQCRMSWPLCFGILNASLLIFSNRCHFHFVPSFEMLLHSNETRYGVYSSWAACVAADINSLFKRVRCCCCRFSLLFHPSKCFYIYEHLSIVFKKNNVRLSAISKCALLPGPVIEWACVHKLSTLINKYAFHLYLQWHSFKKNIRPERSMHTIFLLIRIFGCVQNSSDLFFELRIFNIA